MTVPLLVQVCPHRRDDDGHVLTLAARHHRVDRHVLGGDGDLARRHGTDDDIRIELGRGDEVGDELRRGRHDRQAVGPASLVIVLEQFGVVAVFVTRRVQRAHRDIFPPLALARTPSPRPVEAD